jgi:hypothetical protein
LPEGLEVEAEPSITSTFQAVCAAVSTVGFTPVVVSVKDPDPEVGNEAENVPVKGPGTVGMK